MTQRAPLGLTRPLVATIAPIGSGPRPAHRRGERLSWRRLRPNPGVRPPAQRYHVHNHWPLTVNLLIRTSAEPDGRIAAAIIQGSTPAIRSSERRSEAKLIWERQRAAIASPPGASASVLKAAFPVSMPHRLSAPSGSPILPSDRPVSARTLHRQIEQRWLHRQGHHLSVPGHQRVRVPGLLAAPDATRQQIWSRKPVEVAFADIGVSKRRGPVGASPMRVTATTAYADDPLVRRTLRRIAVTPLAGDIEHIGLRRPGTPRPHTLRPVAETVAASQQRRTRVRAAEQLWPEDRGVRGQSLAQSFAPSFSAPAMSPHIALSAPAVTPSAMIAAPDVNRLVDEVMRRIERQTRQDRLRRGL